MVRASENTRNVVPISHLMGKKEQTVAVEKVITFPNEKKCLGD
jgi:hypothetical protein